MDFKIVNDIPITDPNVYLTHLGKKTPLTRDRGNGYGTFITDLFLTNQNPVLRACNNVRDRFNVITGNGMDKPIVWIIVPFQTTGVDNREEQRQEFLREFSKIRDALSDKIELRVRFARQVFSSYLRKFPHPFSEKRFYGSLYTPKFNRGALLNAAINTIQNAKIIFTHDVDLLPANTFSYQAYSTDLDDNTIAHLAGSWERYTKSGKAGTYLGGIAGMTLEGWKSTNGYPNDYFGWGGEDDEFLRRVKDKGIKIDHYTKDRFTVRDLEEIDDVDIKRRIIGTREADNLVKNELKTLYTSGIKKGGLDDIHKHTIIVNYITENDWSDIIDIVILPSAYTSLPKDTYIHITEEDSRKDIYREALYKYKIINGDTYNWNPISTVSDPKEEAYLQMRLPVKGYGMGDNQPTVVKTYRSRFKGLDGYQNLIMDEVGAYSISYPETGEQMANIIKMIIGKNASIIDGTACLGGNTGYFSQIFDGKVIGIEINPFRANFLKDNIENVYLKKTTKPTKPTMTTKTTKSVKRLRSVLELSLSQIEGDVFIVDGDSQELLLPEIPDIDLEKCNPIADALFVDPPWGGPGYGYVDKKIGLEMTTRKYGNVSAASYLLPIIDGAIEQRKRLGLRRGILSRLSHVFMKVPQNYDLEGLVTILAGKADVITPMILIPDRTKRDRVYFVIIRIIHD